MSAIFDWLRIMLAALRAGDTQGFYDRIAPIYDRAFTRHGVHAERMIALLQAHCRPGPDVRVLDHACGTGMLTMRLHRAGYTTWGMDLSLASLDLLRNREPLIPLVQADAASLPFAKGSFDAVLCLGSWRHFPDQDRAASQIAQALKPGGVAIISYFPPAFGGALHLAGPLRPLLARVYGAVVRALGYADRVDTTLETEARAALSRVFARVETVPTGAHWHALLATGPLT